MGIEQSKDGSQKQTDLAVQGSDAPDLNEYRLAKLPVRDGGDIRHFISQSASPEIKHYLQTSMLQWLDQQEIPKDVIGKPNEHSEPENRKDIPAIKKALRAEIERGEFGPESQKLYKDYVTNYVNGELAQALRKTIFQTLKLNEEFQPAPPFDMPLNSLGTGMPVTRHELAEKVLADKLALKVKLDPDRLPDLQSMQAHIDALDWKSKQDRQNAAKTLDNWAAHLNKKISESKGKYPVTWLLQDNEDKLSWCLSVASAMNLRERVAGRVDFWNYAKKMGYYGGPDLPFGVNLERDKNGDSKSIKIPLPARPYLNEPEAKALLDNYRNWLAMPSQDLSRSSELLKLIDANPLDGVMQGYSRIPAQEHNGVKRSPQGVFSKDGEFMYLAPENHAELRLKDGQKLKEISLIHHDIQVKREPDGSIVLVLTKQAMNKDFILGRDWMAEKVGEPKVIVSPKLNPQTPVFVNNGIELQAIRAEDVASWAESRKASDSFWEVMSTSLDVGMFAVGGLQLMALKAGKSALMASGEALSAGVAARTAFVGLDRSAKLAVGASWLLDNSKARQYELLEKTLTAKSLYIAGDAVKNLALLAKGPSAQAAIFNKGIQDSLAKTAFLGEINKNAEIGFRVSELPMTAAIAMDMKHQLKVLENPQERFDGKLALGALGDGQGMTLAGPGDFDTNKKEVLEAGTAKLNQFKTLLLQAANKEEANAIKTTFSQLEQLLAGKLSPQDKQKLIKEWAASFAVTHPSDMRRLEESNNGPLSVAEIDRFFDPESRALLSNHRNQREMAEYILGSRSKTIADAHAVALLYASRDADGKVPKVIAKFPIDVPEYRISKTFKVERGEINETRTIPSWQAPRKFEDEVTSARVIRQIERLVEKPRSHEDSIIFGDLLVRTGRISHRQYAQTLLKVLDDPIAGKEAKMMALSDQGGARVAAILDALNLDETARKTFVDEADSLVKQYGGRAKDLEASLFRLARNETDADVKAMAAGILYGYRRSRLSRQEGVAILHKIGELWQNSDKEKNGDFANKLELERMIAEDLKAGSKDPLGVLQTAAFVLDTKFPANISEKQIALLIASIAVNSDKDNSLVAVSLLGNDLIEKLEPAARESTLAKILAELRTAPADESDELGKSALLSRLPDFYQYSSGAQQVHIEDSLRAILSKHDEFGLYKNYRLRALEILEMLPVKNQFERELSSLAKASRYPELRQKAFSILRSLQSKEIAEISRQRLGKEKDPNLSMQMADAITISQLHSYNSKEVDNLWNNYVETLDKSISSASHYPLLRNFKWRDESKFLAEEVFLLDHHVFKEEAAKNAINSWWFLDRLIGDPDRQEQESVKQTTAQREAHWKRLTELSQGNDPEKALKARYLLYQIATSGAVPVTRVDNIDYIETDRQRIPFSSSRAEWEAKAVKALIDTTKSGTSERDFSLHLLRMALTESNPWPSPAVRRELLKAWKELASAKVISQKEYLLVLASNARAERIRRRPDYRLQEELATELALYPGLKQWSEEYNPKPFFWSNRRL